MRILVTGATGFVGQHVVPLLAGLGHRVRAAVRHPESPFAEAVAESVQVPDIGPDTDWSAALDGIEGVVHLAARVHVMQDTAADPLTEFRRVNTEGTRRLAEAAAAAGVKRLIHLSSVKALADEGAAEPLDETSTPDPHTPYGLSKLEAERALTDIACRTGLEVAVLRPPLVYGPGVGGNFLSLLKAVSAGLPLPLGGFDNRRSLIYVGNLADAVATCLTHPQAPGGRFLVHDGQPLSTAELVRAIGEALGRPARLVTAPSSLLKLGAKLTRRSDMFDRLTGSLVIDDGAIRRVLGWQPPHDPASGLRATATWFKAVCGGSAPRLRQEAV